MSSVEVKTDIAASPAEVYKTLMDFESYPEWNPMIVKISGTPAVGSKIEAHVKMGDRSPQVFKPVVLTNDENKEFRWVGALLAAFVYRGEHYFKIEPTPDGCTFIHGESFSGLLQPLISMMLRKDLEPTFRSFNDALKGRVEGTN